MIKPVRAWLDSQGAFHVTREDACKAEFRRLLELRFAADLRDLETIEDAVMAVPVETLVEALFDLDKMIGEATKEDSRVELANG